MMIGAKENGNLQLADEIFKSCVRGAGMSLTNKEVINFETGEGVHSDRQLWSIAGTLAGYYRVLFGMNYDTDGILFTPYVPEWMNGPFVKIRIIRTNSGREANTFRSAVEVISRTEANMEHTAW